MAIKIDPSGAACGATVTGVDLTRPLTEQLVAQIRSAWLEHLVLSFPGQQMSDDDLERFTCYFGGFGEDPFIAPISGREHVIAVQRSAEEQAPLFAENWHTDWSFQARPPSGTCLFGITIPSQGGDTWFANQQLALEQMPAALRQRLEGQIAIHSARAAYAPEGMYGEQDQVTDRSMDIRPAPEANETMKHPLIRAHPETGVFGIYGCLGYIVGFEGMADEEALELLLELIEWQGRDEFQYRHHWQPEMLVMWDNRAVLHRATGGYAGQDRLLHRTTIAAA